MFVPSLPPLQQALVASSIPAMAVIGGSSVGAATGVPAEMNASLSYFTAGVLLAALGMKLIPEMLDNPITGWSKAAAAVGYLAGAALMIFIGTMESTESQGFPWENTMAMIVFAFFNGFIIGVSFEEQSPVVALLVMFTIGLESFLDGLQETEKLKEKGSPEWTIPLTSVIAAGFLVLGTYAGTSIEGLKGGSREPWYFVFIGVVMAVMQSYIVDVSIPAAHKSDKWYPAIFQFLGFIAAGAASWSRRPN